MKKTRYALCHPERKHLAKGLCQGCYHREYAKINYQNQETKDRIREHHLQRTYNLSIADFEALREKQGGKCLLCDRTWKLSVDHDHKTGRIRGLLCLFCNSKLGWFENRREQIEQYLGD